MTDDLPIVDAHQHFWDPPRTPHPWLSTAPPADFRYGDYSALRRRYLPDDFRRDTYDERVVATVHVEAEWDTADEVGETRWLARLRRDHGLPTVAIGHARFEAADVDAVLAGHAAFDCDRLAGRRAARRAGLDGRSALAPWLRAARRAVQAFCVFVADLPAAQQRALFHDNAARIYRIPGI